MRRAVVALLLAGTAWAAEYRAALPGYRYEFPRDHFNHPEFQTEWWYYTGNLESTEGRRFGFELTFFRQAAQRGERRGSVWQVDDVWLAHLALSDVGGQRFRHTERLNRTGPGLAGASLEQRRVWNGNWEVKWRGRTQELRAVAEEFGLSLTMEEATGPVIHGKNGVSQKGPGAGHASHYLSFPRLLVRGTVEVEGKRMAVSGTAWMDHEFFTHQLERNQTGWDWFSIQLEDGSELMLFRLRRSDGAVDPYSAGTYIDADGRGRHLAVGDFVLTPHETWASETTKARYPVHWTVTVKPLGLTLEATTPLAGQELTGRGMAYWEGCMDFAGSRNGAPAKGRGYLEMTGYDKPVVLGE